MNGLTDVQKRVLKFIRKRDHLMPTRQEIAIAFGWESANSAQQVLVALQKKGFIKLHSGKSRGIEIL